MYFHLDNVLAASSRRKTYKQRPALRILVIKVRMLRRIVYPVLFVTASLMLALFYPILLLIFYAGAFALLMLSKQLNLYKIVMMLKRAASNLGVKLRYEIRIRLHLGFRDYSNASLDSEDDLQHRTHGYVR